MIRAFVPLLVFATLLAPVASAQCSLGEGALCDAAESAKLDVMFGEFADIALIGLGLFAVAAVVNLLLWLLSKLKPNRFLKVQVPEKVKEVEPGGTVKFKVDVANQNQKLPIDVFLEGSELPEGWSQQVDAAVILPSGFRLPQAIGETGSFTLSSEPKGAHRAQVLVRLATPSNMGAEESMDYTLKAVPVARGRLRKSKAKTARLSVLVTPHVANVQITRVEHIPSRIVVGSPVSTRAFLSNTGERPATDIAVSFLLNGLEVDKKVVPSLGTSGQAEVEFNWTPLEGENKIRVALAA